MHGPWDVNSSLVFGFCKIFDVAITFYSELHLPTR